MRVLLVYQFFGPYHLARWRHWRGVAADLGWTPLALQLFGKPDLYQWQAALVQDPNFFDLGLETAGRDAMRWRDAPRLLKTLRDLHPDVVVVNGWGMRDAVLTHLWCRLRGIARVLVSDSQAIDFIRTAYKEQLKREIIRGVGSAFVAGAPHRRYVADLGVPPERITDGCDVVDNVYFTPGREQRRLRGYRLLTLARFSEEKNLLRAGRAFMRFINQRPAEEPWCWSIAGYGPLQSAVQAMAEGSGGRIRLLGAVEYADLPTTLAQADVYWQPSLRDSWALPVNEAMAAGLPVLVSNRCGCQEDLVNEQTGWTFDPNEERDMVRVLMAAADAHNHWPMMGQAATAHIADWGLERFSAGLSEAVRLAVGE